MGAHRGPPLLPTALLLLLLAATPAVLADTNVTVDDTDTVSITYDPPSSWAESTFNSLDAGGSHATTADTDATATFSFTGTAIYYWAPLWPSRVTTALALDGAAPVLINMRDMSQPLNRDGGETVQSAPLWSATGLDDTVHTLVISVGAGEGIAVVDQLQYTESDADSTSAAADPASTSSATDSASSSSPASSTSALPTPTKSASSSASSSSPPGLSIAIGIVVALFACLGLGALAWWWRRRVRRRRERAEYLADLPPPEMGETNTNAPPASMGAALGRTRSARYRDIAAYFGNGAGEGSAARRNAPLPPVPRRKAPPPVAKRRSRPLGTIPEVHPRDVLLEDEELVGAGSGSSSAPPPGWADVRLVGAHGVGGARSSGTGSTTVVDDREDPWTIRAS